MLSLIENHCVKDENWSHGYLLDIRLSCDNIHDIVKENLAGDSKNSAA